MKKFLKIGLFIILLFPCIVFAAGSVNVSKTSLSVTEGGSATFKITAKNSAGNIVVSSSDTSVATVSVGSVWIENESISVTIKAKKIGTAVISVKLIDVSTFDEETLSGTRTVKVTVKEKAKPVVDNRSSDASLKSLSIDDEILSLTDGKYQYVVSNYVEKVNINAIANDSKAKVSGIGTKDLTVGNNNFDVVVTAENEKSVTYNVVVIRSKYNELTDFNHLVKVDSNLEINVSDDTKITKDIIDTIIKDGAVVNFNKVNETGVVLYTWSLDGSNVKSVNSFNPNVLTSTSLSEKTEKSLNYASGIYLNFNNCVEVPEGATLKYYVADKYKNGDKVHVYRIEQDTGKVVATEKEIEVLDGYVSLNISDPAEYFVSKSEIGVISKQEDNNVWFIVSMILLAIVVTLTMFIIIKFVNKKIDEDDSLADSVEVKEK